MANRDRYNTLHIMTQYVKDDPSITEHHMRHRPIRGLVLEIVALGPRMNQMERRILRRILRFMQSPEEAIQEMGRPIRFSNPRMLPGIVEWCRVKLGYYEPLITNALAENENLQPEEPREFDDYLQLEERSDTNTQQDNFSAFEEEKSDTTTQQENFSALGDFQDQDYEDINTQQEEQDNSPAFEDFQDHYVGVLREIDDSAIITQQEEQDDFSTLEAFQNQDNEVLFQVDQMN